MEILSDVRIPKRKQDTHKGDYGRILLIGGNATLGGAIMLAARACVYSGSGLITVATHPTNHVALHSRCPEAMVIDINDTKKLTKVIEQSDCILIGPGLGLDFKGNNAMTFLLQNIQSHHTLIVDGDAISIMSKLKPEIPPCKIIYTPHQKEWERLSGIPIEEQTYERNRAAVDKIGATVVLKKHGTEIFFRDNEYKLEIGTPAMATGGMGDTLAGMITSFIGQFDDTIDAVTSAAYTHSYIGEKLSKDMYVVPPSKIIDEIPYAMKQLEQ
ncbi:NAD(P)H-hydrate dehydratase [Staphylococcus muscae]|uniref:ADP-dependent (S)-NAD(P)H-hydrate dehydratase n=1 Tax=Staphylococcus muscae TaxID=1294 RepID=A0A240BRN5_9STAP|nr:MULTISPECIES: NAD(P)H-hydrate dehydratase [Staphylococcus]AVQ33980.1 NAD(P)H-hydrate dehydratase [Staphylococcus muscae]PNZ05227.1 NAD(P)H-hydrate dehydratase [Staphylococcus muscae]UXR78350.1 NAD(P)H-hydrate dehydratase [Staphylococcus sp. IVB6227]UXR82515.1 NAD(P)H-hydrate dehydratase [Staphylococcus sp. IVB6214]SNV98079.1 carbohydrate kinase family protein [Staphylococcus muscae]